LRSDAPRVLAYVRRREHDADGLRPLCRALDALSARHPDHDFVAIHSLQSHICDAMTALIPRRGNLRDISPLPHQVFVRELMRARLVVTDSAGVAREALLLGRPLVLIGDYSRTESLDALAVSGDFAVAAMEDGALKTAVSAALSRPAPGPAPASLDPPPAGQRAAQAILEWWKQAEACTTNR
jgi:UDP-N-acetylglucosamine 2-epimerase (non-hydrolysing)